MIMTPSSTLYNCNLVRCYGNVIIWFNKWHNNIEAIVAQIFSRCCILVFFTTLGILKRGNFGGTAIITQFISYKCEFSVARLPGGA